MKTVNAKYEAALQAVRVATQQFRLAQQSYRAGLIEDAEFLAARDVYAQADKFFEAVAAEIIAVEGGR